MKQDIQFYSENAKLSGHLYTPKERRGALIPGIVLCHGFAGIKEVLLPQYAERFAEAGFYALTFDYRGFGVSEGERGRVIPSEQVTDIRNALTFLQTLPDIGALGLWGTSFGGGNAIMTAALDSRVEAITSQLTFGSGERMIKGNKSEHEIKKLQATIQKAWQRMVLKNKSITLHPEQILTNEESGAFFSKAVEEFPLLKTKIPLFSLQHILEFKPEKWVENVHCPALFVGAENDMVSPVEEMVHLHELAHPPKKLHIINDAKHYDVYQGEYFDSSSQVAVDWFTQHLQAPMITCDKAS